MSANTLDLSRFPAPLAIRGFDYEAILAARKVRLKALLLAAGIEWDVDSIESDPAVILQESDAYREMLVYASINDAVRAVMVAFAVGTDLDHLAAQNGVQRILVVPATNNAPAIYETDTEFRRRVLLAPEAFAAAGPAGAYLYHALTADSRVLNADVWSPSPGDVTVAIQSREGDGTASSELLTKVSAYLKQDHIQPLTDTVSVRSVTNVPYSVSLNAFVLPGPDATAVKSAIEASIYKVAADRRTPSRDVPKSAIIAAAQLPIVDKIILASPAADIARGYGEVGVLTDLNVVVTSYAG